MYNDTSSRFRLAGHKMDRGYAMSYKRSRLLSKRFRANMPKTELKMHLSKGKQLLSSIHDTEAQELNLLSPTKETEPLAGASV